jgi:tetratricopeptide (TPR) repeat protein
MKLLFEADMLPLPSHRSGWEMATVSVQSRVIRQIAVAFLLVFVSAGALIGKSDKESRKIFDQAYAQLSSGNYSKALELYEKASQLDPDNAEIWMEYASCLRKVGRYQSAARAGWRAVEVDPQNAVAWLNLGNVFLSAHAWESVEFCYQQVAKKQKDKTASAQNFLNLGFQQKISGLSQAAMKAYDQALVLTPDNPLALIDKGVLIACDAPQASLEAERLIRKGLSLFEIKKNIQGVEYAKESLSNLSDKEKLCNLWQPELSFIDLPGELRKQPEPGRALNLKIDTLVEKRFSLPDGKVFHITTPENWMEQIPKTGPQASIRNVDFIIPEGNHRMRLSIMLTGTENPDLKAMIDATRKYLSATSAEKEIAIVPFAGESADGYYLIATDKELIGKDPQPDNFKYIVSCVIGRGRYFGSISVFSNQNDQNFMNEILKVFKSWAIDQDMK